MFSKQYICLVAGLREYTLESDVKGFSLSALLEEVLDEFSSSDAKSVRLLYGYYDCENLSSAYAGRSYHSPLGLLSREQIEEAIGGVESAMSQLPSEVAQVVEAYISKDSGAGDIDTAISFERNLFESYFVASEKSKSRFLREWSQADRNLRNVSAAITARAAGRPIADVVVGEGDVVDQLTRSSAVDFGLRGDLSYLDAVISAVGEEQNIVDKEHRLDQVRWSLAEELSEGEYFSADFVLAYLAKINIIERWRALDVERGREMFAKLMSELNGKDLVK